MKSWFLFLLVSSGLVLGNVNVSSCGNYSATDYFDLTKDLVNSGGARECLFFSGSHDVALNCKGHSIDSSLGGVTAIGLKSFSIQNCVISGSVALRVEGLRGDTRVFVYNNSLVGKGLVLDGLNWDSRQFRFVKVNGSIRLTNVKTLTALDSDYDESRVKLFNGINYSRIERYYSVNLTVVDSQTLSPLSATILLNNSIGEVSQYQTDVNGQWRSWLRVSSRTPSSFVSLNPYSVTFVAHCHRKISNPAYYLVASVVAVVGMVFDASYC